MGHALVTAFELTSNATYLDTAITLLRDIQAAWDDTCCGTRKGGLWCASAACCWTILNRCRILCRWDRNHTQKATASNAGGVILALRVHQNRPDPKLVDFAVKVYKFWRANMVLPSGQVSDHYNHDGTLLNWSFTYNQGG